MIHPINKGHNYNSQVTSKNTPQKSKTDSAASPTRESTTAGTSKEGLLYSPVRNQRQTSPAGTISSPMTEGPLASMSQIKEVMNASGEAEGTGVDNLQDRINNIKANPNTAILQAYTNKQSVIDLLA